MSGTEETSDLMRTLMPQRAVGGLEPVPLSAQSDGYVADRLLYFVDYEPVMRWFSFLHLPPDKRVASRPFAELAIGVCQSCKPSLERTKCLDRLLESKDAAVRAAMP